MIRVKPPKKEKVKITRDKMEKHELSYLFKNYSEELKDKIDNIEIEHIPGAIISHVYFKQQPKNDKPKNPRQHPKVEQIIKDEDVKKDKSAYDNNNKME